MSGPVITFEETKDVPLIIAGDIGGTNSRFALYLADSSDVMKQKSLFREQYKNDSAESFLTILLRFIDAADTTYPSFGIRNNIKSCCFAVAGPVSNNLATLTNVSFMISGLEISRALNIQRVKIINDFVANGYGILTLTESEKLRISEKDCTCSHKWPLLIFVGEIKPDCPKFCIGAGTGLGECYVTPNENGGYDAWASEGGHVEFAPRTPQQTELWAFLRKKFNGRISIERVVSGKGLVNVYEFLASQTPEQVDPVRHKKIMEETEGAKFISEYAYDYKLAKEAIDIMLDAYGAEFLPYGGIYIAGGIAPIHAEKIKDRNKSSFLETMHDKGRLSAVLDHIPVWIVEASDLGLRGAHYAANAALTASEIPNKPAGEQDTVSLRTVEKWGWVESAVYASGVIAIGLFTLAGVHSVWTKYRS